MLHLLCLLVLADPIQPMFVPEAFSLAPYASLVVPPDEFPELEYTYVEANYVWSDSNLTNDNLNGWSLTGSFELPFNIFVQGTVLDVMSDADLTTYKLGAGWHFGFLRRFDAYGILSYAHAELDNSNNNFSSDGATGELGVRMLVVKSLEVNGRFLYQDIEDSNSGGGVGARFYFTDSLSVGGNYDSIGSDQTATAGMRFEF